MRKFLTRNTIFALFACCFLSYAFLSFDPEEVIEARQTETAVAAVENTRSAGTQIAVRQTESIIDATERAVSLETEKASINATETAVWSITPTLTSTSTPTFPASNTPLPTNTLTPTDTPVPSNTLTPTNTSTTVPSRTPQPVSENQRDITTDDILDGAFIALPGVESVDFARAELLPNGESWFVVLEVKVEAGRATEAIANSLRLTSNTTLNTSDVQFSAILDDGTTAIDYVWDNQRNEWSATELTLIRPDDTELPSATLLYVVSGANARECAEINDTVCPVISSFASGQTVQGISQIDGDSFAGSSTWWEIEDEGMTVYVHSSLLSTNRPPTSVPQQQIAPPPNNNSNPAPPTDSPAPEQPVTTWSCAGDIYNCGDFNNRTDLMSYFNACPGDPSKLDNNNDGVPCESLR